MKLRSYTSVPLLAALLILMLLCAEFLLGRLDLTAGMYLLVGAGIQLLAYGIPLLIYGLLFGGISPRKMRFRAPTAVSTVTALLLTAILLIGGSGLSMIGVRLGWILPSEGGVGDLAISRTAIFAAFVLLPAVCEEILFRGVILSAFEPCGIPTAILATSLLFGFAHMSVAKLPIYIFASILLCFATYVTRSIFVPMVMHLLYNTLSVFGTRALEGVAARLESFSLLVLVMALSVILLSLLALAEAARVYQIYGERGYDSGYAPAKRPLLGRWKETAAVYLSIPFLLCVLIYLAVVILSM